MRAIAFLGFCSLLAPALRATDDSSGYGGFQLGMTLPAAVEHAGRLTSDVKVVHQRPALIQELEWQPKNDAIRQGLLSFYAGELSRIVVTYDRYKVEGMTPDDMIEAISESYGVAARPAAQVVYRSNYGDSAAVLARWENTRNSLDLIRSGDGSTFVLILYAKRADALAQNAIAEALRLDEQEAPQRRQQQQKQQEERERLEKEKARALNKPKFRP